jgi:hypothetical protein
MRSKCLSILILYVKANVLSRRLLHLVRLCLKETHLCPFGERDNVHYDVLLSVERKERLSVLNKFL